MLYDQFSSISVLEKSDSFKKNPGYLHIRFYPNWTNKTESNNMMDYTYWIIPESLPILF